MQERTRQPYVSPRVIVVNTSKELIDWLKTNYGGGVSPKKARKDYYVQAWVWALQGKAAIALAKELEPYLIVKREQVKRLTRIEFNEKGWIMGETAYNTA